MLSLINDNKKTIHVIALAIIVVVVTFVAVNYSSTGTRVGVVTDVVKFGEGWFVKSFADDGRKTISTENLGEKRKGADKVYQMTKKLPYDLDKKSLVIRGSFDRISVYIGGTMIYSYGYDESTHFKKNYASTWISVPMDKKYEGKNVSIYFPVDTTNKNTIHSILLGESAMVYYYLYNTQTPTLLLALLVFGFVILNFILSGILRFSDKYGETQSYIALFLLGVVVWVVFESILPWFIFENRLYISAIKYIALLLLVIPFDLYMMEVNKYKDYSKLNKGIKLYILYCIFVFILRALDLLSFRDLAYGLYAYPTLILGLFFISIYYLKWDNKENRGSISFASFFMLVMLLMELVYFAFFVRAYTRFVIIGGVVFAATLTRKGIQHSMEIISETERTRYYELLSIEDKMTGFKNQNAYHIELEELSQKDVSGYAVVFADVNNLKKTNDKYGHAVGDEAIKSSIQCMHGAFNGDGSFYRIGGDEFVWIGKDYSVEQMETVRDRFNKLIKEKNSAVDYELSVAFGYAFFDPKKDKTIKDTIDRADVEMYSDKRAEKMKTHSY